MDKLRKYKGITLISLVVTIIILIILAGISISMILGNEGLLNKAKYATESYSNAQQQEELELAKYSNDINSYVSGNRDYETEINNLKSEIQKLKNLYEYSTTDKIVGTWVDGEPVYQKTFTGKGTSTGSSYYTIGKATELLPNVKNIVNSVAYASYSGYLDYNTRFYICINSADDSIKIGQSIGNASNEFNYIVTIQYTKTQSNTTE